MFTKQTLIGHVYNSPDRVVTFYMSKPTGFTKEDLITNHENFTKSFNLTKYNVD